MKGELLCLFLKVILPKEHMHVSGCRVETDLGWKVVWDAFIDVNAFARRRRERQEAAKSMRLGVQLSAQAPPPPGACHPGCSALAKSFHINLSVWCVLP